MKNVLSKIKSYFDGGVFSWGLGRVPVICFIPSPFVSWDTDGFAVGLVFLCWAFGVDFEKG